MLTSCQRLSARGRGIHMVRRESFNPCVIRCQCGLLRSAREDVHAELHRTALRGLMYSCVQVAGLGVGGPPESFRERPGGRLVTAIGSSEAEDDWDKAHLVAERTFLLALFDGGIQFRFRLWLDNFTGGCQREKSSFRVGVKLRFVIASRRKGNLQFSSSAPSEKILHYNMSTVYCKLVQYYIKQ